MGLNFGKIPSLTSELAAKSMLKPFSLFHHGVLIWLEDPIKNEGARVVTTLFIDFAANSEVSDGILPKFKPIQAFMADRVTCKN